MTSALYMPVASSTPTSGFWRQDHRRVPDGRYHACLLEEPYEEAPEHDALIAKIDACNKADAEAQTDPHFF